MIDEALIERVAAHDRIGDLSVYVGDSRADAFAAVTGAAVTQLCGLELARRSS